MVSNLNIPQCIQKADVYIPPYFEKTGTRLYMNENLYGPSPKCLDILKSIGFDDLCKYTYGRNELMEKAIAEFCGLNRNCVLVNNGSSETLRLIMEVLIESGDTVLLPNPGWSYYKGIIMLDDGSTQIYDLKDSGSAYYYDSEEMVKQIKKITPKLVIITSPNMPTGNRIKLEQLEDIIKCAENGFVLLDEAYFGFSKENLNINKLLEEYKNFIVVRTFSKCYALASLRVGYMLCNPVLREFFNKKSPLFGISYPAQLMAVAALSDKKYYDKMLAKMVCIREDFIKKVNELEHFSCYESEANFILIKIDKYTPSSVVRYLKENDYLVRDCCGYGLHHHIRISIGKENDMKQIYELLAAYSE